jgi:hypothetical protein
VFAEVASCDRASDTPVARSWGRAAFADDCAADRSSQDRVHPPFREERGMSSRSGVPSFGGTLGLPSAGSIPIRALRPRMLSVNVHGVVRPSIASSSSALGRTPCDAVREVHPRPEPPPTHLLRERVFHTSSAQGSGASGPRSRTTEFHTGFSGLATADRSLQRMFDARARPRAVNPPPREAPASVRVCLPAARVSVLP